MARADTSFNPSTGNYEYNPWSQSQLFENQTQRWNDYFNVVRQGDQRTTDLLVDQAIERSRLERSQQKGQVQTAAPEGASSTDKSASKAPASALLFKPVAPSLAPKMFARAIAGKGDPAEAEKFLEFCLQAAKGDLAENPDKSLQMNDVSRAVLYYLTVSREVALTNLHRKGPPTPPTEAQTKALREQVRGLLLSDQNFAALNDHDKQLTYETLLIWPVMAEFTVVAGGQHHDEKTIKLGRSLARDNLKQAFHISPERMRFTDAGLVLK